MLIVGNRKLFLLCGKLVRTVASVAGGAYRDTL